MASDKGTGAGIMLIDDHPAFRQGLALVLSQDGYRICGEAGNRGSVLSFLEKNRADMALLDISLGEEDGLELIPEMRRHDVAALVYSMHEDPDIIERAFNAGAMGYVTKRETADVLLDAVAAVLNGNRFISPRCAMSIASRVVSGSKTEHDASLSEREKQVLRMLGNGESIAEIANALTISSRTVESYLSRIMDKLKLDGMKELRRYAISTTRQ
jgi:DNA-binding NarL/FixJ family response regulator